MVDARGRVLPDFLIVGAQKAGTASLSDGLASRGDVFMSDPREPMFFCRDDARVHPHTLVANPDLWRAFDWGKRRDELLDRYAGMFTAGPGRTIGEGSTSYLHAERVPERVFYMNPDARIVVSLREPVSRAYSAYWHHVKNFRVIWSFEDQLKYEPGDLLEIGRYARHIRRWLDWFPPDQLHVVAFEQATRDWPSHWAALCAFLELPPTPMDEPPRANEALVPRAIRTQRALNLALRGLGSDLQGSAVRTERVPDRRPLAVRLADKGVRAIGKANRRMGHRYPPLSPSTRAWLTDWFARENEGLADLVGFDPYSPLSPK